jgi:hypothetical protein
MSRFEFIILSLFRYLAASHIATASKEGYEAALQTISVLRNISNHASTSFLCLKALCGLDRIDEAEAELTSLIGHPGASADVCLNAIEILLQCKRVEAAQSAYKQVSNHPFGYSQKDLLLKLPAASCFEFYIPTEYQQMIDGKTILSNDIHAEISKPSLNCKKYLL